MFHNMSLIWIKAIGGWFPLLNIWFQGSVAVKTWDPSHWTTWLSLWWNLCWPWDPPWHDLRIPLPYILWYRLWSHYTHYSLYSQSSQNMAHYGPLIISTHCIPTTFAWKWNEHGMNMEWKKTYNSPILPGSQVSMRKTPRLLPALCRRLRGTARLQRQEFGRRKARLRGLEGRCWDFGHEDFDGFDGDFMISWWSYVILMGIWWFWYVDGDPQGFDIFFFEGLTHGIGIRWGF